jgi:alpha-amylase
MKRVAHISLVLFTLLAVSMAAHSTDEWRSRSIYQVITDRFARTDGSTSPCQDLHKYCGGTFKGLEQNLDYIKNMGFDAVWISPIPENFGNDYHGYGALTWYKVNPYFGSADDLKSLVNAMHAKDMWLMLDVVANHVAYIDMDFEKVSPFNKAEYYHDKCQINNWNDLNEVEQCRLSNLPDLNQDNDFVRSALKDWVKWVLSEFDIDGLRIDTIPEVKREFWKEYTDAADCYAVGEVFNSDMGYLASYQGPLPAVLNYPSFFTTRGLFMDETKSMYELRDLMNDENKIFPDATVLGTFSDNHDNARFLSYNSDIKNYQNNVIFNLYIQGIPIVYYGTEQGFSGGDDPENREVLWTSMNTDSDMYKFVTKAVTTRKQFKAWEYPQVERYVNNDIYAFSRGDILVAVTNTHNTVDVRVTYLPDSYKEGTRVCNIFYADSDCATVTDGAIQVTLHDGESKVYVPQTSIVSE